MVMVATLPGGSLFVMKLIIGLLALALLAACETTAPITPTATMKPALAERLAVLNTDEPMPPAEGPEDRSSLRIESTSARICDSVCPAVSVIRRRAEPRATLG